MLEIRPSCEHCNKALPFDSKAAQICTFECTYCSNCATDVFKDVCPNCGGDFSARPIRPKHLLEKYPASKTIVHKPKDVDAHLKKHNL
jgi:hypothetical protein